jgi:hypothetical protein
MRQRVLLLGLGGGHEDRDGERGQADHRRQEQGEVPLVRVGRAEGGEDRPGGDQASPASSYAAAVKPP